MNRNENFAAAAVTSLEINLSWATLEVLTDNVPDIQLLVSGNEEDVDDLRTSLKDGCLHAEQPAYGLTAHLSMVRWMQVVLRIPASWKGTISLGTVAGPLRVRGLNGSDVTLSTVSGDLWASDLLAITLKARTVTGSLNCRGVRAENAVIRTVSGDYHISGGCFRTLKMISASSALNVELDEPFEQLDVTSVAGDVNLLAPVEAAVVNLRTATGRLRTGGVSITDAGPVVNVSTVSGALTITRKET